MFVMVIWSFDQRLKISSNAWDLDSLGTAGLHLV